MAMGDIDSGFGLNLEQRVWCQTGSHAATAVALSTTTRHATAMASMRFGLSLEQRVQSETGSHAAIVAALSTTRSHATAMADIDMVF